MNKLTTLAKLLTNEKFLKNEDGTSAIEYGLIAALISIVAVSAMTTVGTDLTTVFTSIGTSLTGA